MDTSVQIITPDEAANGLLGKWTGNVSVQYVLDRSPYSHYWWDGTKLVAAVTPESVQAAIVPPPAPYNVGAVRFSNVYTASIAALECVDSGSISFSFWILIRNGAGSRPLCQVDPEDTAPVTLKFADDRLLGSFSTTEGSTGFSFACRTDAFTDDGRQTENEWHHAVGSVRTDEAEGQKVAVVYIDDARMPITVTWDGDAFVSSFDGLPFQMGGFTWDLCEMEIADFWFAVGQSLLDADDDIPEATRRKFIDADGWPVDLGANGETPTGTAPTVMLRRDYSDGGTTSFMPNHGTGGSPLVAGEDGTLTSAWGPSEPQEVFNNPMVGKNDLIVGGSFRGNPNRIAAPSNTGTWVLHCIDGVMTWVAVP